MTRGYIKIKISAAQRELEKGSYMGAFIKCDIGFYKGESHYSLCLYHAAIQLQHCLPWLQRPLCNQKVTSLTDVRADTSCYRELNIPLLDCYLVQCSFTLFLSYYSNEMSSTVLFTLTKKVKHKHMGF